MIAIYLQMLFPSCVSQVSSVPPTLVGVPLQPVPSLPLLQAPPRAGRGGKFPCAWSWSHPVYLSQSRSSSSRSCEQEAMPARIPAWEQYPVPRDPNRRPKPPPWGPKKKVACHVCGKTMRGVDAWFCGTCRNSFCEKHRQWGPHHICDKGWGTGR